MPNETLKSFDGQTWVAFSDLCGTKSMYRESPDRAADALDYFYTTVYRLHEDGERISALAVSDSVIFWVQGRGQHSPNGVVAPEVLEPLLAHIQSLHSHMLERDYLVRTTLAYGRFSYRRRLERPRLRKEMILGWAYLDAYAANDKPVPGGIVIVTPKQTPFLFPDARDVSGCAGRFGGFLNRSHNGNTHEYVWWATSPQDVSAALRKRPRNWRNHLDVLCATYRRGGAD